MSYRTELNVIEVQHPCRADWEAMSGGATPRFCTHCQKNVYNFSAMNSDVVQKLICESGGSLCARFARSEAGDVITLDYQPAPRRRRRWQYWTGEAFLAATAATLFGFRKTPTPAPPVFTMGDIAPSYFTTTPVASTPDQSHPGQANGASCCLARRAQESPAQRGAIATEFASTAESTCVWRGISLRADALRRSRAELLHHAHHVKFVPSLDQLSVFPAGDGDAGAVDFFVGWRHPQPVPFVRGFEREAQQRFCLPR